MATELSIAEKMKKSFGLALRVGYSDIDAGKVRTDVAEEISEKAFVWIDGLMHKFARDRISGRCSLEEFMQFDPAVFEQELEADIRVFSTFLEWRAEN